MTVSSRISTYIALTWGLVVAAVWFELNTPEPTAQWSLWGAVLLLVLAALSERFAISVPNRDTEEVYTVSVATIPHMMCALLLPPVLAAVVAGLAMLIDELIGRRPTDRVLFNTGATAASVGLTAILAHSLGLGGTQLVSGDWHTVLGVMLVALAYCSTNTLLIAGIGAIASGRSLAHVLFANVRYTLAAELAATVLGGLAGFVWMANPFWVPIALIPVVIAQLTLRYLAASNLKTRQLAALDRLGRVLSATLTTEQVFREASAQLQEAQAVRGVSGSFVVLSGSENVDFAEGLAAGDAERPVRMALASEVAHTGRLVSRRTGPSEGEALADHHWLALPLLGSEDVRGCFGLVAARGQGFGAEDIGFFQLVAERIILSLENVHRAARTLASEQLALRRSEERFRALVRNAGDVIVILERDATINYQSPAAERVWGLGPEQLVGQNLRSIVHSQDHVALKTILDRTLGAESEAPVAGELRLKRPDGTWRNCELIMSNLLHDPGVMGMVATFHDVTERKAFETQLSHMALHDSLSGLPNRALFLDRLERGLLRASLNSCSVAVLFLDLDDFKVVNDSLGHDAGDRLLTTVGSRLRACVRPGDTVARLGGDEFAVLLEQIESHAEALDTAERVALALRAPCLLEGREIVVRCSIGIAFSSDATADPGTILRNADMAMYQAKRDGKASSAIFDDGMQSRAVERLEVETDLRRALQQDELRVFYQPIVSLTNAHIVEFEALVRWAHAKRGLLPPAAFVSLAEETGLIVPIGAWVLEQACAQLRIWQQCFPGRPPLAMSVNLSARQFQSPSLAEDIERIVQAADIDPSTLKLEITESVIMQDAGSAVETLNRLKSLGIQLVIDDFGTGYSSLAYLKRFPVDTLKIDQSFVDGLGRDPQDTAIVRSVVALARSLDLSITAEGVETPEQKAHLTALGCERGQGYLFSRPVPNTQCTALLEADVAPQPVLLAA